MKIEDLKIYSGKKIFVTGHTGFKGAWLSLWLKNLGAEVYGYALEEPGAPAAYSALGVSSLLAGETIADISDSETFSKALENVKPDFIFHLAAQSLVRHSYRNPLSTLQTNFMGTAYVLDFLRLSLNPLSCVIVTSDKCYQNKEQNHSFGETDPMGGKDVYSMSKGACELLVHAYQESFFKFQNGVHVASARAGNVIGGGDYAEDRIIPDCVRAIRKNEPVILRQPQSIRPWQHVLEPLSGYLVLGAKLLSKEGANYCEGWNFGPPKSNEDGPAPVQSVVENFYSAFGQTQKPFWKQDASVDLSKMPEAKLLQLSIQKAQNRLKWSPHWDLRTTLEKTAQWYERFEKRESMKKNSMRDFTLEQIESYVRL